jgi:hypothetical protein
MDEIPKISVVNRNYIFTQMEDKIAIGDVFGFSIKEKTNRSAEPREDGIIMLSEQNIMQPLLTSAILVKVFDETRIQLIDEDGTLAIIDRNYFKDFIKVYDKESEEGILFYGMVLESVCMTAKSMSEFALKQSIMCSLSKGFLKMVNKEVEMNSKIQKTNTKKLVKKKNKTNIFQNKS